MTTLTAVIPSHGRPEALRECLRTIADQEVDPDLFDVVVIDDGSPIELSSLVTEIAPLAAYRVRCIRQSAGGLNAARNRGIEESSADVIAFLDDDTIVPRGWANAMSRAFAPAEVTGVGGRVKLSLAAPPPGWMRKRRSYLAEFELGDEPRWLDGDLTPVGANCAARRTALEALGGFRDGLDRLGASLVSNGDTELFRRMRREGGRLRYDPDAWVHHCIPAERLTVSYFRRRARAQGVSDELLATLEGKPMTAGRRFREVARFGRALPILAKSLVEGEDPITASLWIEYCRGRWQGLDDSTLLTEAPASPGNSA